MIKSYNNVPVGDGLTELMDSVDECEVSFFYSLFGGVACFLKK